MRKRLQLALLLSCILLFCSHSFNTVDQESVWSAGSSLEESFSDIDNDSDDSLAKTTLFTDFNLFAAQKLFLERNSKKAQPLYGIIRGPPLYSA